MSSQAPRQRRSAAADPAQDSDSVSNLAQLSLEELLETEVTLVSRRPQKISEAPAAVYVITDEEIRRSGATSIPEALRLAPGLDVARVDAHQWAISARGFNDVFANKLLVMMDGRSVYTPLYSGVYWDAQDTLMEDIDRIEVIRGPGATLWGANAVNGVINIVTKDASATQGLLVTGGGGTEELGFGGLRYGGKLGEHAYYRVYGKYFNRDDSKLADGTDANDAWQMGRGGFRVDWQPQDINRLTLQGDFYAGQAHQTTTRTLPVPPYSPYLAPDIYDVSGQNLLGRWTHTISDDSDLTVQTYFDRTHRDAVIFSEDRNTFDVDVQHHFHLGERQNVVWGGGYRVSGDDVRNSFDTTLEPSHRNAQLWNSFVQDEVTLVDRRLVLTLGSKFEHNDYTRFEIQPGGRLLWTPNEKQDVWASVARAVRTPSRAEHDIRINQPPPAPGVPFPTSLFGSDHFDSEKLIAYELGYRIRPHRRVSLDLAGFYNVYDDLRSLEPLGIRSSPAPTHIGFVARNQLNGETYGGEAVVTWRMLDWWRWRGSYSLLETRIHTPSSSGDTVDEAILEGSSPQHQVGLHGSLDLPGHVDFDTGVRYVSGLPAFGIGSYVVMDLRLAWRPRPNLELSLVGQNLLDNQHPEFAPTTIQTQLTEVQHSVYAKVTWRF